MANVQISEELFINLVKFFLLDADTAAECKQGLQEKLDKLHQRSLYSAAHDKNLSADEREQARQAYLDEKGIPKDFRW